MFSAPEVRSRPNILLTCTGQHRWDVLSAYSYVAREDRSPLRVAP